MKKLTLLEFSENKVTQRHRLNEHPSELYTHLLKLDKTEVLFAIECSDEEETVTYGTSTENWELNFNQPVVLAKDGSKFKLQPSQPGFLYFNLNMSDPVNPLLLMKMESISKGSGQTGLDHFLDTTLPLTLEVGRTEMAIEDLLTLGTGSVIELDRLVGEELQLCVGDNLVARGEVVTMGAFFAVRLTEILPVAGELADAFNLNAGDTI